MKIKRTRIFFFSVGLVLAVISLFRRFFFFFFHLPTEKAKIMDALFLGPYNGAD